MNAPLVNVALVASASLGMAASLRILSSPLARIVAPRPAGVPGRAVASAPGPREDPLRVALIAHDPFRITRRPSAVPYDVTRLGQPATPRPPRPTPVLLGIVWDAGTDPTALVDGLPGADGPRPVRRGETVGGLRVTAISRDRVVVRGLDTTWTLTVREPWR